MSSPVKKRFYQEADGRWYIDLPEYIKAGFGTKANLEMIAGADLLLTNLADGRPELFISFNETPFEGYTVHLKRSSDYGYDHILDPDEDPGGWYDVMGENRSLWLCPVTLYVFNGCYPPNIFIQSH